MALGRVASGRSRRAAGLAGLLALAAPVLVGCDPAVVLAVDTTADAVDADPGDGACAVDGGGCSLRAAVQEANALGGDVVVDLAAGETYRLTLAGRNEDGGATGDLDTMGANLRIRGHGATVDAGGLDRVWDHHAGRVDLLDVTISGGAVSSAGGGLRVAADMTIVEATITGNRTDGTSSPEGIAIQHTAGTLTIVEAEISGNDQDDATVGTSAAVHQAGGELVLAATTIRGNSSATWASILGSGHHAGLRQVGGHARLVASVVADHQVPTELWVCKPTGCYGIPVTLYGVGVVAGGTMEVVHSRLVGNTGDLTGGGVVELGASQVGSCAATGVSGLGFNRFGDGGCDGEPHVPGELDDVVDQIPVGTPRWCDATTPGSIDGVSRPVGAACDIGPEEH